MQNGIDSQQFHVFQVESKSMCGDVKVWCCAGIPKTCRIVRIYAYGQADMVEGDGWVLGQIVDIAQELVRKWAYLYADVFLFQLRD